MYRPLLMHRARGLCGPFFKKAANLTRHMVHGTGNFISAIGGVISAPPNLTGTFDLTDGTEGDSYYYNLNTLNTGGRATSWAWNGVPPIWANLNTSTGIITGVATPGTWSGYSVTASNIWGENETPGSSTSNTDTVTISVATQAPIASGVFSPPDGQVGIVYSYDTSGLFTGGSVSSYSLNGTLPVGLSFDTITGIISGTPTTEELSGALSVTGTNGAGSDTTNTAAITITSTGIIGTFIAAWKALTAVQDVDADGNIMNLMPKGTVTATSVHSTPLLAPDKDGIYRDYPVDAPVWKGATYLSNWVTYSEDFFNPVWLLAGSATVIGNTVVTMVGGGDRFTQNNLLLNKNLLNNTFVASFIGSVPAGTKDMDIRFTNSSGPFEVHSQTISLTSTPTLYIFQATFTVSTGAGVAFRVSGVGTPGTDSDDVTLDDLRINFGESSDYVKTEGTPVVKSLYDSAPDVYLQANKAATNLNRWSADLANWSVAAPATATFDQIGLDGFPNSASLVTVNNTGGEVFINSGSFVVGGIEPRVFIEKVSTSGILRIQNTINESEGRWDVDLALISDGILTASSTGVTIINPFQVSSGTDSGIWFRAASEELSFIIQSAEMYQGLTEEEVIALPPIFTTTAAASIPATNYTFPAANIDPADSLIEFNIEWEGDDTTVLAIGATQLLEVIAGNLTLSDGTNSVALPVTLGNNTVSANLTADTMTLTVGGTSVSGPYVPIAAGLITVEENIIALRSNPSEVIA